MLQLTNAYKVKNFMCNLIFFFNYYTNCQKMFDEQIKMVAVCRDVKIE